MDRSIVSGTDGTYGGTIQSGSRMGGASLMGASFFGGQTLGTNSVFDEQSFRNFRNGNVKEELIIVEAPAGKLGVVIDTPDNGAPILHRIKDTCPIADQLRVNDKLIAVDDEDVTNMTAVKVSKLISQKSGNAVRKFTILRSV
jgi:C-terminal processing protease CtpA/Prc